MVWCIYAIRQVGPDPAMKYTIERYPDMHKNGVF